VLVLQPEETQVHLAGKDIPIFEGRKDAKRLDMTNTCVTGQQRLFFRRVMIHDR
jgi:hypothetical protein